MSPMASFRSRSCAGLPRTRRSPNLQPQTYSLPEIVLTSRQMRDTFIALELLLPLIARRFLASRCGGGGVDRRGRTTRRGTMESAPLAAAVLIVLLPSLLQRALAGVAAAWCHPSAKGLLATPPTDIEPIRIRCGRDSSRAPSRCRKLDHRQAGRPRRADRARLPRRYGPAVPARQRALARHSRERDFRRQLCGVRPRSADERGGDRDRHWRRWQR